MGWVEAKTCRLLNPEFEDLLIWSQVIETPEAISVGGRTGDELRKVWRLDKTASAV
jgi:hypothetical protein